MMPGEAGEKSGGRAITRVKRGEAQIPYSMKVYHTTLMMPVVLER